MKDTEQIAEKIRRFIELEEEIYAPVSSLDFHSSDSDSSLSAPSEVDNNITSGKATSDNSEPSMSMDEQLNACTTLDELRALCEKAEVLKTDLENTRLVFGKGNPEADLMLIGEAPGAKEDAQGEPFVGASGQLLTKILAAIKIERKDIYIANILKHRPPDNRNPKPEERARSLPFLERQIDIIKPKLILCLGLVSAQTLLESTQPLKELRGTFHTYRTDYQLTVTYHPAALLRNKHLKRDTWADIQQLRARYDEIGAKPLLPSL